MSIFLSVQHTYSGVEIALFDKLHLQAAVSDDKKRASKTFIALIDELLASQQLHVRDIAFCAVNQGPGPFTTLRVVIASMNGLNFATKIPLIGIDGLDALVQEYGVSHTPTIALLNAFTQDVYYAIHDASRSAYRKGYQNITTLLLELHATYPSQPLYFIGNGSLLHETLIKKILGEQAIFAQPLPEHCSINRIGLMGYHYWQNHMNISQQLSPLYLKTQELGKAVPHEQK
ncbi:tRNA (adenosine(37)-N6)-threonylcarbamoyltransferase complex dimerization subunit type 1 TsaB [Candidatus Dependentiae bacterium]|nr:tRNA (adenosine(37)-N6)-threonylcarbamoyltransferase complex dimerization subunit type 1 TsaB [Candidatus Dependentiae bacterium]